MSVESTPITIDLPDLKETQFGLASAGVRMYVGKPDLEHPQLVLEGDEDAFEHSYEDGVLRVDEQSDDGVIVQMDNVRGSIINNVRSSTVIVGGSIRINGIEYGAGSSAGGVQIAAPRNAKLLIPEGHNISHNIHTMSGDVALYALYAKRLNVATMSGNIILQAANIDDVRLKTMSGDIDAKVVHAKKEPRLETMSGDVHIEDSQAPSWRIKTMSGDIRVQNTKGESNTSTMSGSTRFS